MDRLPALTASDEATSLEDCNAATRRAIDTRGDRVDTTLVEWVWDDALAVDSWVRAQWVVREVCGSA